MYADGRAPHCTSCGSLERHRANRALLERLPAVAYAWRRALQFSPDMALVPTWFRHFEVSVYEGSNSLDLQKIARADGAYDFISLSHVLEFIPDDRAAVDEIERIMSDRAILHLVLSHPLTRAQCEDFGEATGTHRYFHLYGRNFAEWFELERRGLELLVVEACDPVTGEFEAVHLLTKSPAVRSGLEQAITAGASEVLGDPAAATRIRFP
jgi:hypothetical protein